MLSVKQKQWAAEVSNDPRAVGTPRPNTSTTHTHSLTHSYMQLTVKKGRSRA